MFLASQLQWNAWLSLLQNNGRKMSKLILILISIFGVIAVAVIISKFRTALKLRTEKNLEARRQSIKPSLSFYLKKPESLNPNKKEICIKNTGLGKAENISINDFYHPEEKDWCFKFQKISQLDPDEEKTVDFDFIVRDYKASNKNDQLWMFDPEHGHDFAARIIISYCDIEKNAYDQTITIGEENKKQNSKKLQLQLIQRDMSQR
jgi:hypothetical protein